MCLQATHEISQDLSIKFTLDKFKNDLHIFSGNIFFSLGSLSAAFY